jgi:hypothetical protein
MTIHRASVAFLVLSAAILAAAGCGGSTPCEGPSCLDVATIRQSEIAVLLSPDTNGVEGVTVSMKLHAPSQNGACYQIPADFEIKANGRAPRKFYVVDFGHDGPTFPTSCTADQGAYADFDDAPVDSETLAITFSRGGDDATVTVTRALPQPVDVTFSTTDVSRQSTFSADLQPRTGTLPSGKDCWMANFDWDGSDRAAALDASAAALGSGVRLTLGFPALPDLPTGPGKLELRSVGDICDPGPSASCPGIASCTASQEFGRLLGPFALNVL